MFKLKMAWMAFVGISSILLSGDVWAQRDAAAKSRGEFGTGFWSTQYDRPVRGQRSYQPRQAGTESYRAFSYEPIGISAGDTVVVIGNGARLMKGEKVISTVPNGTRFKVTRVSQGWLGTAVDLDGRKLAGWIWHKDVAFQP